jgi:Leucine-rich repeat (LRR) protein
VTNLVIKNDTNYTIIGNDLTNVLHIFNYEVYKLPKEIFSKFTSLKHLVVNANHLKILESDTFDDADKLEVLRFSNNDLEDVPSYVFKNMKSLKTLDLGRNKIESLHDDSFRGLGILERLYLSDNNLKIIPKKVFYPLRKIVTLSLENNQISELGDDTFRYNVAMRSLGLSNNTFSYLQTELFRYFLNLSDLSISDLRITTIDLNGTSTINTLVIRNTDLLNITMSNFPKILVSYGTNLEVMKFIVNKFTANFTRIPNWGGMYYNKNIRFIFFIEEVRY